MRVIAGRYKGRKLCVPKTPLRPTQDRVREAVYSTLLSMQSLEGLKVLDLFSGTGAFGFEALSRGASFACFVERDAEAIEVIIKNAEIFGIDRNTVSIMCDDVFSALFVEVGNYDVISADPPYGSGLGAKLLTSLLERPPFENRALFVFEDDGREELPTRFEYSGGVANLLKRKEYSGTVVRFFELTL